jgi:hypothetical protein
MLKYATLASNPARAARLRALPTPLLDDLLVRAFAIGLTVVDGQLAAATAAAKLDALDAAIVHLLTPGGDA